LGSDTYLLTILANISLLKTFCASASTLQDRSRAIAIGSGGLALGLAMGPSIQMLFVPLRSGWEVFPSFRISMYTAPAIFAICVNAVAIFAMLFIFEERYAGLANNKVILRKFSTYLHNF
jgi:hypothetical protein